jgi:nucleoside-diphosphate-sugar epimerase
VADGTHVAEARILVSGASGFIGANLVRALRARRASVQAVVRAGSAGWRLRGLDDLALHDGDLTDRRSVEAIVSRVRPDAIVHLGTPSGHPRGAGERDTLLRASVLGTHHLLEAACEAGVKRFVHVCSSTVYGPGSAPYRESDPPAPTSFRGAAKAAAAQLCRSAVVAGQPVVVVRPFVVYGQWQARDRFIPTAIRAALRGRPMALTVPGLRRDWIHVSDVVEGCLAALVVPDIVGEVINLGTGLDHSNEEVVELVEDVTGRRIAAAPGAYPTQPSDRPEWRADICKAGQLLGWSPRHDLRSGLEVTVEWFRAHERLFAQA